VNRGEVLDLALRHHDFPGRALIAFRDERIGCE
jgi:hypothetical protein